MSFCRWALCLPCIAWLVLPGGAAAHAQSPPELGVLTGVVADPSGAKVPHARLHLAGTAETAGILHDVLTDGSGRYTVELPAGAYTVTVQFAGFRDYVATAQIAMGMQTRLDLAFNTAIHVEELTIPANSSASTAAADNASALVFRGAELESFSEDDATFQKELLALAGGGGPQAPQIFVNGFSGGQIPPKSTILSIRINRNPYSAAYQDVGNARVEITTRAGGDNLHGYFQVAGNDNAWNARNPYTGAQPPYYTLDAGGNLSGPLDRRSSFFVYGDRNLQQFNSVINAQVLNQQNAPVELSQSVPSPQTTLTWNARADRQFTATNSLFVRYEFIQVALSNAGLGVALTLPSQAYNTGNSTQTLQLADTQAFSPHLASESHLQYIRTRVRQDAVSNAPTLLVEGSFNGGGNPAQSVRDNQDRYEFEQTLAVDRGAHYLNFGVRYRLQRDANLSTANYNGQFVFPTLAAFAAQQSSQFSITTGAPGAVILTGDLAAYAEDEWKVAKNVTLDLGLRLESQSAIPDHLDTAPRIGGAWALYRHNAKSPTVQLRGGLGLFYDRFSAANLLTAVRQNGISQQTFTVNNPTGYPQLPATGSYSATPPTIYRISPGLRSQYGWIGGIALEKFLGKFGTVSANYQFIRGLHQWGSTNINAPLPGTYNPSAPSSGIRPLGGSQNIYQFDSEGIQKTQLLYFNTRLNLGTRVSAFLSYSIIHNDEDVTNATTFASNSYNLSADYGRVAQPSQQLFLGGTVKLPLKVSVDLFANTQSGVPFNITTGTDLNGDTIFNDRPAFATAPSANSVVYKTRFGSFEANPQPGETVIPINYGNSPAFALLQLSVRRRFAVGPRAALSAQPGDKSPPALPTRPWQLGFAMEAANILNHNNPGLPVGVLSSPFFGKSINLANPFSSNPAANRAITLRTSFTF